MIDPLRPSLSCDAGRYVAWSAVGASFEATLNGIDVAFD